ncbi:MAG: hypothetical protein Q4C65_06860 [Eubacteriales bacterium]|nr:hypothetical protein [Eubacteriales bacterium]
MLKIKAPIPLVCRMSVLRRTDNFCQRVTGNYQILTASLNEEELLHLVTAPPEVYLAEGGMTTLVDASSTQLTQDIKLDIMNNVLNRILVSDTYRMTYQDQVFVSAILRKIGVENVQEFLHQVSELRQESRSRRELTRLYWSHLDQLQEWKELLLRQPHRAGEAKTEEEKKEKEPLWLHQTIFNRLKTGAIYQEIQNFVSSFHGSADWILDTELQVAEQWVTAQNILLNRLKNAAGVEPVPLEYHHVNIFELGELQEEGQIREQVKSGLVQAVLLNALDQMYTLRLNQLLNGKELWYQLAGAVHQSVSNTLERWEAYHISGIQRLIRQPESYMETVNRYQSREIETLHRLLDRSSRSREEKTVSERQTYRERLTQTTGPSELIYGEERRLAEELSRENRTETKARREETEEIHREESELWRELERINQQNRINREKVRQLEDRLPAPTPAVIDRERARRDVLRAIDNPQDVLLEYLHMETGADRQQKVESELREQLFSQETREILETLEKIRRTPQAADPETMTLQAQDFLMRELSYRQDLEGRESWEERLRLQENRTETVSREVTQLRDRQQKSEETAQELWQPQSPVELIHKRTENGLDEETLEELSTRVHRLQESRQTVEEHTVREETTQRQSVQEIRRLQTDKTEEIAELVRRNLQQQIGFLSDQIYGKMEKRLDGERRRRGL